MAESAAWPLRAFRPPRESARERGLDTERMHFNREQIERERVGATMTVRILIADDHKMMREGLRALLARESDFEIVGEASETPSVLEALERLVPDVVVLDVSRPDRGGVELARRIRREYPSTHVIATSTHADERYVLRMLDAGASGYVLKNGAYDELVRAVRAASVDKVYLSPEIAGVVVEHGQGGDAVPDLADYSNLGPREREVLQFVAEGKTSAETAREMHISVKTVETHRRNIAFKLKLHGTAELTKYALREGLTSLET